MDKLRNWFREHPGFSISGLVLLVVTFLRTLGHDLFFGSISDALRDFARSYLKEHPAMTAVEIMKDAISFAVLLAGLSLAYWFGRIKPQSATNEVSASHSYTKTAVIAPSGIAELFPDWTIRELFFHVDPSLLDWEDKRWEAVSLAVRDCLSTGRLTAWGRDSSKYELREHAPLEEIRKGYWHSATLMMNFFLPGDDHRGLVHAQPLPQFKGGPQYRDVHVNKAQVLNIWPITQREHPKQVPLMEAATKAYDLTRHNRGLKEVVPSSGPNDILRWYCYWFANHIPIYGTMKPATRADEIPARYFKGGEFNFIVADGIIVAKKSHSEAKYENLYVMSDRLDTTIKELSDKAEGQMKARDESQTSH